MKEIEETNEQRRGTDRRVAERRTSPEGEKGAPFAGDRRQSDRRFIDRRTAELPRGLHHLDLPQPRTGFRYFLSSWFFIDSLGRRILVDPGPASSIPLLLDKLSFITDDVDFVLLTHIHPDHSGGIGQFCQHYRNAKVLVHPKAVRYLCDPAKLWLSALEVLGDIAEMYGAPLPLPPESILNHELPGITILETPGHAPHHLTFFVPLHDEKLVFVGESAGLFLPLASSPTWPYLRPTTPPKFDAAAARNSLDKIAAALQGDELLCYGHWGAARRSQIQIGFAKEQLEEWLSIVSRTRHKSVEEIADYLLLNDTFLGKYADLPGDLREREFFFIANSVKGILEYLQDSAK